MTRETHAAHQPADFGESDRTLQPALDTMSGLVNYQAFLSDLITPHLKPRLGSGTLEIGAGHGDLTGEYARSGPVLATDLSEACLNALERKFGSDARVRIDTLDVAGELPRELFGAVVMVNVLEHIEDDVAALRRLGEILAPGGRMIVFVPAFEALYGDFDRRIGHRRRYRKRGLSATFRAAGYDIDLVRYVNLPGYFAWWLTVRVMGREPTEGRLVTVYDRVVMPAIRWIETRIHMPFGQSLLCVGSPSGHQSLS